MKITTSGNSIIPRIPPGIDKNLAKYLEDMAGVISGLARSSSSDLNKIYVNDGWINPGGTWSYAGANLINIPSGVSDLIDKGDKIRITQGGSVKYFYVTNVTSTQLTVTGGTDFTVANSSISDQRYSKMVSPHGFPAYFNYTPSVSASSGSFTSVSASGKFSMFGAYIDFELDVVITTNGTAAGGVLATLPTNFTGKFFGTARETVAAGTLLYFHYYGTNQIRFLKTDNTYPGVSGYTLSASGRYHL